MLLAPLDEMLGRALRRKAAPLGASGRSPTRGAGSQGKVVRETKIWAFSSLILITAFKEGVV